MRSLIFFLVAGALLAGLVTIWLVPESYSDEFAADFKPQPHDWATSDTCQTCHQDHYESWHRTYHRTMTQEATPQSVLGDFNAEIYRYWGFAVRPVEEQGKYYFDYLDANDQLIVRLPILRTVGSHRYQQYLTQTPDGGNTYFRIHLVWHMEDQRWMHINGVFLRPDEQGFDDRVAVWNHNCIFCHNTGPQPNVVNMDEMRQRELSGAPVNSAMEARYDSSVAELGIACESCHGPGAEHARRNRNPLRRLALQMTDSQDPTIVHPKKVDQERSVALCGQCHGQRTPLTRGHLMEWIRTGPTFRSGDLLQDHVVPVFQDIEVPPGIDPDIFRLRFWNDGTARLTAYEYQGVVQSACFDDPELTCVSCHSLHEGDIKGNITEENRGNTPCLKCHTELAENISAHTKHETESSGSLCYDCHMPRMIFGIADIHRSHRIEVPRPAVNNRDERPNACTNCHLDRSIDWAQTQTELLWGTPPAAANDAANMASSEASHLLVSLHAGDPVQRAVAARLAGNDAALPGTNAAWLIPHLLVAMEDNYPSTRNLARKSLLNIYGRLGDAGFDPGFETELLAFDFIGDAEERRQLIARMRHHWRSFDKAGLPAAPDSALLTTSWQPLQPQTTELVRRGHSHSKQIAIGE